MVSFEQKMLVLNGRATAIDHWEVWFMTPFGLIQNLDEAVSWCIAKDLDPDLAIQPVTVALDSEGRYEVVSK